MNNASSRDLSSPAGCEMLRLTGVISDFYCGRLHGVFSVNKLIHAGLICAVVMLLAAWCCFYRLGEQTISPASDEVIHIRVVQEMLHSGRWWQPTHGGEPYFNKPPFKMWLNLLPLYFLGESNFSYRVLDAFSGVVVVALTILGAWRIYASPGTGMLAALFLLGIQSFILGPHGARRGTQDSLLVLLCTAALLFVWELYRACPDSSSRKDTPHRRIRRLAAASGVMIGLAVLTKTVSGLLPLAIAAIFLSTSSKRMYFFRPLALAALIAIVLPALYFTPHCLFSELACESFFTKELFHRVRYGYHNPQDTWLYLRPLFRGHLVGSALLIWLMLCWAAWRVFAKKDAGTFFLCVWAALPLAGYTCIPSRQFWYIAPAFVPLSLLMGRALWSVAGMCCTLISPLPGYRRLWQLGGSLACMLLLGHAALVLSQDIVHTINGAAKKSPRPLVDRLAEEIISTARQHPERAGVITLGETLAKDAHPKYGHFSTEVIYRGMIEGYFYNAADLAEAQALAQSGQFGFLIAPLALEEELLTLPSIHAYQILGPSRFRKEALLVLGLSPSSGKRPALLNTKRVYNFASAAAPPVSGFGPAEHLGQFWARALDGNRSAFFAPGDRCLSRFGSRHTLNIGFQPRFKLQPVHLAVYLNHHLIETLELKPRTFTDYSFNIPAGIWDNQTNILSFEARYADNRKIHPGEREIFFRFLTTQAALPGLAE